MSPISEERLNRFVIVKIDSKVVKDFETVAYEPGKQIFPTSLIPAIIPPGTCGKGEADWLALFLCYASVVSKFDRTSRSVCLSLSLIL